MHRQAPLCTLASCILTSLVASQTSWSGPTPNDRFGISVAIIDDVSPVDGVREVLIGAPGQVGTIMGAAYVHRVGATAPVRTHSLGTNQDSFGEFVGDVGDVDGDGVSDYGVGAPNTSLGAGRAYIFSGASGTLLHTINAPMGAQFFGFRMVAVGDLNADAKGDVAIGAVGITARGHAYVYLTSGATMVQAPYNPLFRSPSTTQVDQFSHGMAFLGGAGNTIAIGAPRILLAPNLTNAGGVFRWNLTATTATLLTPDMVRNVAQEQVGTSVAAVGDVNGDSVPDVAAGVPYFNQLIPGGAVSFFSGSSGAELHRYQTTSGTRVGHWLGAIGDVDSDNVGDVIAGAIAGNTFHVASGANGALITTVAGSGGFGAPVDAGPDIFGVGGCDILAGHFATGTGNAQIVFLAESKWVGAGCVTPPPVAVPVLTALPRPILNTTTVLTVNTFYPAGTSMTGSMLLDFGPPTPSTLPGGCTWFLTGTAATLATFTLTHPPSSFAFNLAIPNNPAYVGVGLVAQTVFLASASALDTSNAVTLRIGSF